MDSLEIMRLAAVVGMPPCEYQFLQRFAECIAAVERDACAQLCDDLAGTLNDHRDRAGAEIAESLKNSIRARGAK